MANYVRVPFLEIKFNQLLPYIITFEPKKYKKFVPDNSQVKIDQIWQNK